jgi:hypothetical protein
MNETDLVNIELFQRMLDRADSTGKAQFRRELEVILSNSRAGGAQRPRFYWGVIRRYRSRDIWQRRIVQSAGNLFLDGWQAAERFHGIEVRR